MKLRFYIDKNQGIALLHFAGALNLRRVLAHFPHLWKHPDFSPLHDRILDFRDSTLDFTTEDLKVLLKAMTESKRAMQSRSAILVSNPEAAAMGALYSHKSAQFHDSAIFCTNDQACEFLDADPAIFGMLGSPGAVTVIIE